MTRRRAVALVVLGLLLSFGWCGVRLLLAKQHLEAGRDDLLKAKNALLDNRVDEANSAVARAGRETAAARNLTHDPVSWTVSKIPVLGWPVGVGRGLSDAADRVARGVLPSALRTSKAIDETSLRRADGTIDLEQVRALAPPLKSAAGEIQSVRREVRDLPNGLVPAINTARDQFRTQVEDLSKAIIDASDAVSVTPAFLGGSGVKRWFVLVMQTAESRGSGGIPGGYAVLRADQGKLTVEATGSNRDLREDVPYTIPADIPKDYRDRYELDGAFSTWPNVTLSPDFPIVAEVVAGKWRAQSRQQVDGVIAVDSVALSKLLQGSPPIPVGSRSVAADQLTEYLAVGQYADNPTLEARKDKLANVSALVLARITSGQGSTRELLKGVSSALRSGHVRFASKQEPFNALLARTGLDGALPRGDAPVAYAVINNATGGKLDHFLERRVEYSGGACHGDRRDSTITVTLTSKAPAVDTLPPYVTLRSDEGGFEHSSTSRVLLDVFGTRGAVLRSATPNGRAISTVAGRTEVPLDQSSEEGLPVWRVSVETIPGRPQELALDLSEPVVAGKPRTPEQPQDKPLVTETDFKPC